MIVAHLGMPEEAAFGSDFPTVPAPVVEQVRAAANLGLGSDWLRRVLWDNAAALFG